MEGGDKSDLASTAVEAVPRHSAVPIPPAPTGGPAFRFVFVDGLRGLAALMIVVFHIWWYEPEPYPAFENLHWIVDATFRRVRASVQILLVISGFVVAYTLRKTWVTPREVSWFLGRRLVRLMPPYWVTIGVIILVDMICQQALDLKKPFQGPPSVPRISAHLTLMQNILGHEAMSAGIWTICIEMQFYVVAILGWGLAQRMVSNPERRMPRPPVWALLVVFLPPAFVSLFYWRPLDSTDSWVIHYLWMFFLGMITWWTLDKSLPAFVFALVVLVGVVELQSGPDWSTLNWDFWMPKWEWFIPKSDRANWVSNCVALSTAVVIFAVGRLDRLHSWLNWRWLQYLGRISYSLYLIHFPICHLITFTGWKLFNNSPTPVQADMILLVSLLASILAAHLMYRVVEAPSNRLAARMKQAAEKTSKPGPNVLQTSVK